MTQLTGLTRTYIQVRRENDKITYGGDQGFFKGAPSGSEDERKQKMGCGITALGDTLLYLANCDEEYRTQENAGYVNRILLQKEYEAYYNCIYVFVGKIRSGACNGISGIRLQNGFNRMARQQHWRLRSRWGLSGKKIYARIEEMLGKNIPVILCVPIMLGRKNKECGIWFYKKENDTYRKACTVSAHFVVITSVIKEEERIYFKVSSWGEEYYVNWQEYDMLIHTHFLGTILGNILYIR